MGAEGDEEEKDGKFEAGDVCQNFPPFVRSRALSSLPPLLSRVLTPLRGVRHRTVRKERGRAETNDATIRHTREKELSALEAAAPKSLLGLEKRAVSATRQRRRGLRHVTRIRNCGTFLRLRPDLFALRRCRSGVGLISCQATSQKGVQAQLVFLAKTEWGGKMGNTTQLIKTTTGARMRKLSAPACNTEMASPSQ